MNWNGVNVFVTGADGFIGSHLAEALVQEGAEVKALVQYNSLGSYGWLDESNLRHQMEIIPGDIRDPDQMRQIIQNQDFVFHLAALISVPHSFSAPRSHAETNILGTMNVLQASLDTGVCRYIQTSTSEVYGSAQYLPIDESHPISPQSPYAASKVGADAMVKAFSDTYELSTVTLRPFNTYGPRQSERAVIPTIIRQALDPDCNCIKLGNLETKRDLLFVEDTVSAFIALADSNYTGVYNAGWGKSVTIGQLASTILEITGEKEIIEDITRVRPNNSEVTELMADISKIKPIWSPEFHLNVGLSQTVGWWAERIHKVRSGAGYTI